MLNQYDFIYRLIEINLQEMQSELKKETIKDFTFILDNKLKFNTKLAIMSFYKIRYTVFTDILLALVEYLQLFSLITLLIFESTLKDMSSTEKPLFRGIKFACQIFSPFYFLYREDGDNITVKVIFWVIICSLIIKYIILLYIMRTIYYNTQAFSVLVSIWRWIFKTQGTILYYIFSSFWVASIRAIRNENMDLYEITSTFIIAISIFVIIIEYIFSLYLETTYDIFPTKRFSARKDNKAQVITITQKLILQATQIALEYSSSLLNSWILLMICILFDCVRNFHHFQTLPFYNMKALFCQSNLLMIITSLDLAWLTQIILISANINSVDEFIWVFWILLMTLAIIVSHSYQKKTIVNILARRDCKSPQIYIHKLRLIKQIKKIALVSSEHHNRYQFWHLLKEALNTNIKSVFNFSSPFPGPSNNEVDINSKESVNKIIVDYLQNLVNKFPKSKFLKLYLAYLHAKKLKQYGKAVKIITELEQSNAKTITLNASLLMLEIQNIIGNQYRAIKDDKINLFMYLKSHSYYADLKQNTLGQTELQIDLYNELIKDAPKLIKISDLSQKIHKCQNEVEKKIKLMLENISDYFVEPITFLAYYHLVVNHSITESLKYRKTYAAKYEKYKKILNNQSLQPENIYQGQNAFMLLSGHQNDAGTIIFCTKAIENIFGGDARLLVGKNISSIITPSHQPFGLHNYNEIQYNCNAAEHGIGWHEEGHMIELDYHLNIFPFLNKGFCYGIIIRQARVNQECLLINENSNIETATKNIAQKLGLSIHKDLASKKALEVPIKVLSEELSVVNKALNMKILSEKHNFMKNDCLDGQEFQKNTQTILRNLEEEIDIEKLKELCLIYTTEGKEITLKSVTTQATCVYHCKISEISICNISKRIFNLEAVACGDLEYTKESSMGTIPSEIKDIVCEDSNFSKLEDKRRESLDSPNLFLKINQNFHWGQDLDTFQNINSIRGKSPLITDSSNLFSPVLLRKSKKLESPQLPSRDQTAAIDDSSSPTRLIFKKKKDILAPQKVAKVEESIAESPISKSSNQLKFSKAFNEAIASKSSKQSFKPTCIFFCLFLIVTFAIQLEVALTWKNNLLNLKVKKDILNNALLRNYYTIDLPAYFILLIGYNNLKLDLTVLGETSERTFEDLQGETALLTEANNILLSDTNSLSEEMRAVLFYKDVRIFDICHDCSEQPYIIVDNFQATNTALEYALFLTPLAMEDVTAIQDEINLFAHNCLNDLILKNAEISEIFLQSLNNQSQEIMSYAKTWLIITLVFLMVNLISMGLIIWTHYLTEKKNLLAFTKVNCIGVHLVLARLKNFRDMLESQYNFEESSLDEMNNIEKENNQRQIMNKNSKGSDSKGLATKYYLHSLRLVSMIIVLSSLTFWSYNNVQSFLENLSKKQSQLYFINILRSRTNLIGHAVNDLLARGTAGKIENKPILIFLSDAINELITLKSKFPQMLPTSLSEEDPNIKKTLYENGCEQLDSYFEPYCNLINTYGISSSFVHILTSFENVVFDFYQEFSQLNETEQQLYQMPSEAFSIIFSEWALFTAGDAFIMMETIDKAYESMLLVSIDERYMIFGISSATLCGLIMWFWIFTLRDLREVNNRFKRVLKTLPPHLVLSNFFLKLFLLKSSKGNLDFLRNKIH